MLCNCGSGCQENELEGSESNQFKDEETTIVVITNRDKSLYCNGGFFFQGIVIHNEDLRAKAPYKRGFSLIPHL